MRASFVECLQKLLVQSEADYSRWVASASESYRRYRLSPASCKAMWRDAVRFDLRMARNARHEVRKLNAELLAELDRQPTPSVRIVSAVPVAPVQLTLAGEADPVPAEPVRPSWYSRRIARGPSRWCAGMSL